jgi:hypothetical protein
LFTLLEDILIFSLSTLQAYQELGLLLVLVAVAILTYASLVYFAEKENNDGKSSNISSDRVNRVIFITHDHKFA